MIEIPLKRWTEFERALKSISAERKKRSRKNGAPMRCPLFRGLGSSVWGLETTLERAYPSERIDNSCSLRKYYRRISTAKSAVETFGDRQWKDLPTVPEFDELITDNPIGWLDMILFRHSSIYEYIVYLRHHGFPSPLLDWTASPYVAAFFAFDAPPSTAESVAIYGVVQGSGAGGSSDAHLFFVGPYMHVHPRHILQQCQYSICVAMDPKNKDYLFKPQHEGLKFALGRGGELFKITIPISERLAALQHLELMNISAFSLFGSPDSLVRTVARREFLLHE